MLKELTIQSFDLTDPIDCAEFAQTYWTTGHAAEVWGVDKPTAERWVRHYAATMRSEWVLVRVPPAEAAYIYDEKETGLPALALILCVPVATPRPRTRRGRPGRKPD